MTVEVFPGGGAAPAGAGVAGVGSPGGLAVYSSPIHFTATYYSATELTLSAGIVSLISDISQFISIEAWDSLAQYVGKFTPQGQPFAWDGGTGRVTVTGATFPSGGTFAVRVLAKDRYADDPSNLLLVGEVNPYPLRASSDKIELITSAQLVTGAWVDLGAPIPLYGYHWLKLWLTIDIGDGSDLRVRVLEKGAAADVEEYVPQLENLQVSKVAVEDHFWERTVDADQLVTLPYRCGNTTPYGQAQVSAGTPGTTLEIDAAYYTRGTGGL